jgi:hypothetical protein
MNLIRIKINYETRLAIPSRQSLDWSALVSGQQASVHQPDSLCHALDRLAGRSCAEEGGQIIMGQAKQRGTYEQRRQAAIERVKTNQAEQDRLDDLKYAERCKTRPPLGRRRAGVVPAAVMAASWPVPSEKRFNENAN